MVELVAAKVEAAHERADGAVLRIERDESGLDFWQLHDLPVLALALHPDDRAPANAPLWCGLRIERPAAELESLAAERNLLSGAQGGFDLASAHTEHDCREQRVIVRMIAERLVEIIVVGRCRKLGVPLGTTVAVITVVLQHAAA